MMDLPGRRKGVKNVHAVNSCLFICMPWDFVVFTPSLKLKQVLIVDLSEEASSVTLRCVHFCCHRSSKEHFLEQN